MSVRFLALAEGYEVRPFDSFDADDAAQEMAEFVYYSEAGDNPPEEYDVTVIDPDGVITRHSVSIDFSPSFCASEHPDEPEDRAVAELREAQGLDSHAEVTP